MSASETWDKLIEAGERRLDFQLNIRFGLNQHDRPFKDCLHGVRIIRLPGQRFRGERSEEVKPVRDAGGQIDIQGTMQAVTSVIEGWIREYPDQWLWLHRR